MAITYKNFADLLDFALGDPEHSCKEFWSDFSRFISMASYLSDVSPEAGRIIDDYNEWVEGGYI